MPKQLDELRELFAKHAPFAQMADQLSVTLFRFLDHFKQAHLRLNWVDSPLFQNEASLLVECLNMTPDGELRSGTYLVAEMVSEAHTATLFYVCFPFGGTLPKAFACLPDLMNDLHVWLRRRQCLALL